MYAIEPWLLRAAAIAPERAALHGPSGELSYAALAARARAIAGALRERGVRGGERVAIELPPCTSIRVRLAMDRYAHAPTYDTPWIARTAYPPLITGRQSAVER